MQRRRAPIKAVLLAGDVVVGAGNIYACEALFEAGIDPRARCRPHQPAARRAPAGGAARDAGARARRSAARRCATSATPTAWAAPSRPRPRSTVAPARPARAAAARSGASSRRQRSTFFCPGCQRR
ncbi:MAG: hypothetical protein MZW92_62915 [Comamonadaceae bacterium]|nr:hypothetical protein [Comamonadaceae bacterium]